MLLYLQNRSFAIANIRCHCMNTQAKKAAEAAAKPVSKKAALLDDSTEETDPTLYFENRVKGLNAKKAKGQNPYPHKFNVTLTLPEYVAKYTNLEAGQRLDDVTVSVAGASKPTNSTTSSRNTHLKQLQPAGAGRESFAGVLLMASPRWDAALSTDAREHHQALMCLTRTWRSM